MITARRQRIFRRSSFLRGAGLLDQLERRVFFSATCAVLALDPAAPPAGVSTPIHIVSPDVAGADQSPSAELPVVPVPPSDDPATAVTVQLVAPNGSLQVGTPATLTAIVTTEFGQPLDGQYVVLWQDPWSTTRVAAAVHNGFANFTWTPQAGGAVRLAADLPPQGDYIPSVSPSLEVQVQRALPALELQVRASNGAVQLTLAASTDLPAPFVPSGSVHFFDGQSFLGSVDLGAASTLTLAVPPGVHTFTALYGGDEAFAPGEVSRSFNVPALVDVPVPPLSGSTAAISPAPLPGVLVSATTSAALVSSSVPANVAMSSLGDMLQVPPLSTPATSEPLLLAEQNSFGLQFPTFRQFYELSVPEALTADQIQVVAASGSAPAQ